MCAFVAYYRVSTDRQGESGLGLEAQRAAVVRFTQGASLLSEFQEIESGKRHADRPQLAAALDTCRRQKATLVIARLDRLARNVYFISGLMESGGRFRCSRYAPGQPAYHSYPRRRRRARARGHLPAHQSRPRSRQAAGNEARESELARFNKGS